MRQDAARRWSSSSAGSPSSTSPGCSSRSRRPPRTSIANVASLGFDLAQLEADGQLVIDHVDVVGAEMEETGDWDLDGLFLRLGAAIDAVGAKRVVIDTIETLFGAFTNTADPARPNCAACSAGSRSAGSPR